MKLQPDNTPLERTEATLLAAAEVARLFEIRNTQSSLEAAKQELAQTQAELRQLKGKLPGLRIDRQLRRVPRAVARRAKRRLKGPPKPSNLKGAKQTPSPVTTNVAGSVLAWSGSPAGGQPTLLVVCHAYPMDGTTYGGQPIARRVPFYIAAGYRVVIYVADERGRRHGGMDELGARIVVGPIAELSTTAMKYGATHLAVHSPTPEVWSGVSGIAEVLPTAVWIHGFEARNWRLLSFDFSASEIVSRAKRLDEVNHKRRELLLTLFSRTDIEKVFVSQYMRNIAEDFVGKPALNGSVIHNVIDPGVFPFETKDPELRKNIVSVRSFERRNYGTDLATLTIATLKHEPWFDQLQIRVIGDGRHHEEDVRPLLGLPNVTIEPRILPTNELRAALSTSGLSLLPTRWDSQGMMMGESMMAGLVPITNAVAAIPEFVDESSGIILASEDFEGMASAVVRMFERPDEFVELSRAAHERVLRQCGPDATVSREIELFSRMRQVAQ